MLGLFVKPFSILALSCTAIATLIGQCKALHSNLEKTKKEFKVLTDQIEVLSNEKQKLEQEMNEADSRHYSQLESLKQDFEDEWHLQEAEWRSKMANKEEDAQQRLDEIASWQSELARLRTEAIAIRSAIEKVRSRSTSPGREEEDSYGTYDMSDKENGISMSTGESKGQEIKSRSIDPLAINNKTTAAPKGISPLRV